MPEAGSHANERRDCISALTTIDLHRGSFRAHDSP